MWNPVPSNNYSSWRSQFEKQIEKYCASPNAFSNSGQNQDDTSQGLLAALKSQAGVRSLNQAVHDSSLSSYVWGKDGYIAFLVIGIIVFFVSVCLAFALTRWFRSVYSKVCFGACADRARYPPQELKKKKRFVMSTLCILGLLGMVLSSVVAFVYSAYLVDGAKDMSCDFWTSMNGYYFGADNLTAPQGVRREWKGSDPQRVAMQQMQDLLETANQTKICPLCQKIRHEFEKEGGVRDQILEARDLVFHEGAKAILLAEGFANFIRQFDGNSGTLEIPDVISFKWNRYMQRFRMRYEHTAPHLMAHYINDFNETALQGLATFNQSLDQYCGPQSTILSSAYHVANTATMSLSDVDYVMAKLTSIWADSLEPLVKKVVIAIVVISCILGVLGVVLAVFGSCVFFKLNKYIGEGELPPWKFTQFLGIVYVILLVFSGLSFFLGSVLFFLGSAGSDSCELMKTTVFDKGYWSVIPEVLISQTQTNKTDIPTVLDTCIKSSGDGDVAASLGLKMLLAKLDQSIATTESSILDLVDKNLQLDDKSALSKTVCSVLQLATGLFHGDKSAMKISPSVGTRPKDTTAPDEDGYYYEEYDSEYGGIMPINITTTPSLDLMDSFYIPGRYDSVSDLYILFTSLARTWLTPSLISTNPIEAINYLNKIAQNEGHNITFCSVSLNKMNLCSATNSILIDGSIDWTLSHKQFPPPTKTNPFYIEEIQQIMRSLATKNWKSLVTFAHVVENLFTADVLMQLPLSKNDPVILTAYIRDYKAAFPNNFKNMDSISFSSVLNELLPNFDYQNSTFGDALVAWSAACKETAQLLEHTFNVTSSAVLNFAQNTTIGSMEDQLQIAHKNLQDFDCQFVGTSMRQGVNHDLCSKALPSAAALGLTAMFLWLFSGLGAAITWRVYHYYRDVETIGEVISEKYSEEPTARDSFAK